MVVARGGGLNKCPPGGPPPVKSERPRFLKFALIGRGYFRARFHWILKVFDFLVCEYGDPYFPYHGQENVFLR